MPDPAVAVLLAAGHGRRAGAPKAWIEHEGRPLLAWHLEFLRRRQIPVRVTIQPGWTERVHALAHVRWIPVDPDASVLAALQAALADPVDGWVSVHHVDMPVWVDALWDMLAAADATRAEALVPERGGRGGHPVWLGPSLLDPVRALDPASDRLDHFLRTRQVQRVVVDDPCVLENWNAGPPDA